MMKKRLLRWVIPVILLSIILTGCGFASSPPTPTPLPDNPEGEEDPFIGIPNPASFYCEEMGYQLELRDEGEGTEGMCVFPNGAECEEWDFLSGGCSTEWTFCQRQGYTLQAGESMATCVFPDGSTCPEYDFFIGECQPPEN